MSIEELYGKEISACLMGLFAVRSVQQERTVPLSAMRGTYFFLFRKTK